MSSHRKFSQNTGPTLPGMEISETAGQDEDMNLHPLTSSVAGSLVNPTLSQGNARPARMSATFGANSTALFASLNRDMCWVKTLWDYLAQKMVVSSVEYCETWPRAGMMRNGNAYLRPVLARRTSENASSLWHTPNVPNGGRVNPLDMSPSGKMPNGKKRQVGLAHQVRMVERGMWPTPSAHPPGWKNIEIVDKNGNPPTHHNQRFYDKNTGRLVQKGLEQAVKMWRTPQADENGSISSPEDRKGHNISLSNQVGGQLNPQFVEWLMGFPEGWTDLED